MLRYWLWADTACLCIHLCSLSVCSGSHDWSLWRRKTLKCLTTLFAHNSVRYQRISIIFFCTKWYVRSKNVVWDFRSNLTLLLYLGVSYQKRDFLYIPWFLWFLEKPLNFILKSNVKFFFDIKHNWRSLRYRNAIQRIKRLLSGSNNIFYWDIVFRLERFTREHFVHKKIWHIIVQTFLSLV